MKQFSHALIILGLLSLQVSAKPLTVAVSILPQAWLVERIAGEQVSVEVLVGQGHSPATYEPTPRQLERLTGTRLYFTIGVPFERVWLDALSMVSPNITVVPMASAEINHDDDASHRHDDHDPHVWNSPRQFRSLAEKTCQTLLEHLPEAADQLRRNHRQLQQELRQLDEEIQQLLTPWQGRVMMSFHPAWGYFAADYGLRELVIEAAGKQPTARQLASLIEQARSERVSVILVQPQFSEHLAYRIASAIGARIVTADPLPADYPAAMREFTRILIAGFSES